MAAKWPYQWSYATFSAPQGRFFVGKCLQEGKTEVFYDYKEWKTPDFYDTVHYSRGYSTPSSSTGPRCTNMELEITPKGQ